MNNAKASCRGAITVMNAIPTGIGSALGISLQTDAEVVLRDGDSSIDVSMCELGETDLLVKECVKGVFERARMEIPRVSVTTSSSIPISRGLKSSSAAANAVTLALCRALGLELDDIEIISIGVYAAKRAKVTVTGAFDDATACYFGGITVTDNHEMKIIHLDSMSPDNLRVVLHVPEEKIRKEGLSSETFSKVRDMYSQVEEMVRDSRYIEAITLNGRLCSEALGLDTEVSEKAIKAGAIAAGLTGTGPATAILTDDKSFEDVMAAIYQEDVEIIVADLNETPAPEVSPRH